MHILFIDKQHMSKGLLVIALLALLNVTRPETIDLVWPNSISTPPQLPDSDPTLTYDPKDDSSILENVLEIDPNSAC